MNNIEPEYKIIWRLIKHLFAVPWIILGIFLKKYEIKDLFSPFKEIWSFFWEAKFTASIIVANILVFIAVWVGLLLGYINELFLRTYLLDSPKHLIDLNIIPMFMNWFTHLSPMHLFGNMLALFIFGRVVEKNFGFFKTAMIYVIAGIGSSLADNLIHLNAVDYYALGASGAIAGLTSVAMLREPYYTTFVAAGFPIPIFILAWFQLVTDITGAINPQGTVANFAHLGGFFSVSIIFYLLNKEEREHMKKGFMINIITFLVLITIYFLLKYWAKLI